MSPFSCDSDHLVRGVLHQGALRVAAVRTTRLTGEICRLQQTDPTATVALGRLITAAALMSSLLKDNQRLALSVEGSGPLKKLQAEADAAGHICATIKVPQCNLPPRDGHFDVAQAIGRAGFLRVIKDLGLKEPYQGMVQLISSEIGEDLAHYFAVSEQTPTSMALAVQLDHGAAIQASGGFLIQALPGCDENLLDEIEQRIHSLPPVSRLLNDGTTPTQLLTRLLEPHALDLSQPLPLNFRCQCSRQRILDMLTGLEQETLNDLAQQQEGAVITCEYCKTAYSFAREELRRLVKE
ncbi:MAG: Hsp33 family molecular chaperone HslO [Desulfuromonadaceae bacterium]|nr:Hsp33 family molecular chaperone HslO [Desulfuromonadaceae bacterium]